MDIVLETSTSAVIIPLNSSESAASDLPDKLNQFIGEEWYQFDYSDYHDHDCYYYSSNNHTAFYQAQQLIEDSPNSNAQNIVILMGDRFDCHWCKCHNYDQLIADRDDLVKNQNARYIHFGNFVN